MEERFQNVGEPIMQPSEADEQVARFLSRCERCHEMPEDCECSAPPDAQSPSR